MVFLTFDQPRCISSLPCIGCDAIIQGVCEARKNTSIAFLCTPTDLHVIPQAANEAARTNMENAHPLLKIISHLSWGKVLKPNALQPVAVACSTDKTKQGGGGGENKNIYYVDGLSIAQGPNYCTAKRLQHWRAVIARSNGHRVSSNIAPSTATESVVSNGKIPYF